MSELYYGDNLDVLRAHVADESVDLIYLDPPFNSNADYNLLFRQDERKSAAQIRAFSDTWRWDDSAENAYAEIMRGGGDVALVVESLRKMLGENPMMAYLAMMSIRLVELHRALKNSGSIYLHCDSTASHYIKIVMDRIFGVKNFRNEIVWCYRKWTNAARRLQKNHDTLFFYSKSEDFYFNKLFSADAPQSKKYARGWDVNCVGGVRQLIVYDEEKARHKIESGDYDRLVHREGKTEVALSDWWEISTINSQSKERLGYPTQKPMALLERIIEISSEKGDLVLDPFCGCGTAIHAAQKLKRRWIGIDVTHLAINVVVSRLDQFSPAPKYRIYGIPASFEEAKRLADGNKFEFEAWAVARIPNIIPNQKQVGDRGIDGVGRFRLGEKTYAKALAQVKAGRHVGPAAVRDFRGTMERDEADFGVFIVMANASITPAMKTEALQAGRFKNDEGLFKFDVPKIQIWSIEDHFDGRPPKLPIPS